MIIPHSQGSSVNEIRVIYKDENLFDSFSSLIYLDELKKIESKINELIEEKNKPNSFSQPIYRTD